MTLRDAGYGVTVINASGAKGPVHILYVIVQRKKVKDVIRIASEITPDIFISVEDIRSVKAGFFPETNRNFKWWFWNKNK
jgi:uncharacterized protein YebE (UPF0316 family)